VNEVKPNSKFITPKKENKPDYIETKDFFGRQILQKTPPKTSNQTSSPGTNATIVSEKSNIYYKFNNGHTNAVRRKVFIKDFL